MNKTFYHQTVTTTQIEDYISKESKIDFSKLFDQYLRTTEIPVLEYKLVGRKFMFRYTNCVKGFNLPLKLYLGVEHWVTPGEDCETIKIIPGQENDFKVDENFYIKTKKVE